jgi:hypothetical protein
MLGPENADISILCPINDDFGHKADQNSVSGSRTLIAALNMGLTTLFVILRPRLSFATVRKWVSENRTSVNPDVRLLVGKRQHRWAHSPLFFGTLQG